MNHPLQLTKSILDPVHGLIRLTKEELQVVNSRVFQRLRRIKQNGLLSYVFPAASHTRFEHSLGVLFVAESMLEALLRNGEVASAKSPSEVGTKPLDAVSIAAQLPPDQLKHLFRVTRLAALSHDLGHGPLSHTFENFAPKRTAVTQLLAGSSSPLHQALSRAIENDPKKKERIEHEWMSCLLFGELFGEIDPEDWATPMAVAAAIRGRPDLVDDPVLKALIPLIHDLIASAPSDADRMDYIERDSRSCGVSYGLFDRNRVLKSFLCYLDKTGALRLGIKSSGFRAIENFVQARFELYVQVYYHKTNRAVELMLGAIGEIAKARNLAILRFESIAELLESYVGIGDEEFLDMLAGRRDSPFGKIDEIHELAIGVRERRLWRRVEDFREALIPSAREDQFISELRETTNEDLVIDRVEPQATKDLDNGAALLFRGEDGVYRSSELHSWLKASPLINTLAEQEKQVVRVYYKGNSPKRAWAIRKAALVLENRFRAEAGL